MDISSSVIVCCGEAIEVDLVSKVNVNSVERDLCTIRRFVELRSLCWHKLGIKFLRV